MTDISNDLLGDEDWDSKKNYCSVEHKISPVDPLIEGISFHEAKELSVITFQVGHGGKSDT